MRALPIYLRFFLIPFIVFTFSGCSEHRAKTFLKANNKAPNESVVSPNPPLTLPDILITPPPSTNLVADDSTNEMLVNTKITSHSSVKIKEQSSDGDGQFMKNFRD